MCFGGSAFVSEREAGWVEPPPEGTFQRAGQSVRISDDGLAVRWVAAADLTTDEEAQLIELLRRAYNGGPPWFALPGDQVEHLRWLNRDFPGIDEVWTAELDGRIVHMQLERLHRFQLLGRAALVRLGGQMGLEPALQGQGIYARIGAYRVPRSDPRIVTTLAYSAHPVELRRREGRPSWRNLGNAIETFVLPLDFGRFLEEGERSALGESKTADVLAARRSRLARGVVWRIRRLRALLRTRWRRSRCAPSLAVESVGDLGEELDAFFEEAVRQFDFAQERTSELLRWRYLDPRAGAFTILLAREGERVVGFCALTATANGAAIADLLALPGRADAIQALLRRAEELAREADAPSLRCWSMQQHPYREHLLDRGFLKVAGSAGMFRVGKMTPEEVALLDDPRARIHLALGDSDHI